MSAFKTPEDRENNFDLIFLEIALYDWTGMKKEIDGRDNDLTSRFVGISLQVFVKRFLNLL